MSDKDSKNLDKLFQVGSKQFDFEYNPDAWEQMETLLNKDKRRRGIIWWLLIGLGGLLVLAGMWWYYSTPLNVTSGASPLNQVTEIQQVQDNFDHSEQKKPTNLLDNNKQLNATEKSSKKAVHLPIKTSGENNTSKQIHTKKTAEPIANTGIQQQKTTQKTKVKGLNTGNNQSKINDKDSIFDVNHLTPIVIKEEDNTVSSDTTLSEITTVPIAYTTNPISSLPLTYLDIDRKKPVFLVFDSNSLQENNALYDNSLAIGVLLASEVTAVGMDNISKPDFKAGIQIEYKYNRTYSTSIGVNYIRKKYEAGQGEYIPPQGFWTRAIAPQSTQGICNILEVPITMGYYPRGAARNGFYAKAGLTSYFMLRERYDYFYDLPDSDLKRKWGTRDQTEHWFGIGQFSIGHQKAYQSGLSKQLAAYIQAPLTGIGHGNVKMWSIGIRLVINFKIYKPPH